MRTYILYTTAIICGFCMMALEMIGSRYLAPDFGTALDAWAAIITVFILSLSIGYVMGGHLADRSRDNRTLGWAILGGGVFFLLLPIYARVVTRAISEYSDGHPLGVMVAAFILFFPPSLLLGCVSPLLVKLAFSDGARVGRTTGTLYAVGSLGNVLGILGSTYFLLSHFELNSSTLGMGVVLGVTGLAHVYRQIPGGNKPSSTQSGVANPHASKGKGRKKGRS